MSKINLTTLLNAIDTKRKDFYDSLSIEDRKDFSPYLSLRWSSSTDGSTELASYYLMATNQYVNKHFFSLNKHPKLQWLLCSIVSPGMGKHRHTWIKPIGRNKKNKLADLYPTAKMEDLELLIELMTDKEIISLLEQHGIDQK